MTATYSCLDGASVFITILVNDAANDKRHTTAAVDEAFYTQMMDINFIACFFAAQPVVEGMKTRGGGSIISFSSISYRMGNAGYPPQTGANSAISGLTRSLAPADIVGGVLSLASSASNMMAGQALVIDGGVAVTR
jgi:NAD(P)-dependent dehydrogenase (short-subunit alcohol dehydrogenase family)